ncbi:MAG: phosphatidylserine/phosphatidylglycerophosphate/cardiolipin synthase family protein [Candidatus Wallbacteria bacterium]|nr:phosphatidylserine/phosphatidylglycerophosphate/cardiolipin synthase family protein [Candidatus Wallbacteria bacterium]
MRFTQKPAVLGLSVALLLGAAIGQPARAEQTSEHIAVHFAPKPAGDPDGIDAHIVNFFAKAKKTIHGAFYELREQKFADALIAAKKRGVEVKLLFDNTTYWLKKEDGSLDNRRKNAFIQQLLDVGIEVRQDKNRSALMHNKFCVVDGRHVWSGSVNLTDTYATNANNAVAIESPKLAAIYEREFDKKFVKQLFGKKAPSYAEQQKVTVDGVELEVLYAPEDDPMSRILVLLNGAKKSVHFMQFAFTESQVTTILMAKFKAGVKVGGIFDHRLYRSTGPYGDFSTLTRAGVPVQLYSGPGLFHHKAFVIDAGTPRATVITGSQNASAHGNDNNDENVLVLHDQKIADLYLAEYNRFVKESSEVSAEAIYDKDPIADTHIPKAHIMFTSNGVDVKRIKVEYPARWPLDPKERTNISVWRLGRNVTSKVGLEFYGKGFYVNNPEMTPSGPNSVLEVHFRNMKVSAIPGVYNLYISVSQGGAANDFKPIRQHPTIVVKPAAGQNAAHMLDTITEEAKRSAAGIQDGGGDRDAKRRIADEAGSAFEALKEDVAEDISSGKLTSAERFVVYLEALPKQGKKLVGKATGKARDIRRALRGVETDSPMFAQSQALLQRLEAATAEAK